jgi:hypothetical protein
MKNWNAFYNLHENYEKLIDFPEDLEEDNKFIETQLLKINKNLSYLKNKYVKKLQIIRVTRVINV